ncbi:MAG TPA: DUF4864 domain-containing protein [Methylomirabilota bacterium]|jgi:hypothetical protein
MSPRRLGLALLVLALVACADAARAQAPRDATAAAEPVVKQLEAFRRDDYDTAYTFASAEIRIQFDRRSFETMVRRGYPEIASSTFSLVTRTELSPAGLAYVTIKIRGSNGQAIEGLYELVWQDGWKINGVVTRPDAGVI